MPLASPQVPLPNYYNLPREIDFSAKYTTAHDKIYRTKAKISILTGKNPLVSRADFVGHNQVAIRNLELLPISEYQRGAENSMGPENRINTDIETLTITKSYVLNARFDAYDKSDTQAFLDAQRWMAYQQKSVVTPSYDFAGTSAINAFATRNGFVTEVTSSQSPYQDGILNACEALEDRLEEIYDDVYILGTPEFKNDLLRDPKYSSTQNELSQSNQIYQGKILPKINGLMWIDIPKSRMPAGVLAIVAKSTCLIHVRKINIARLLNKNRNFIGTLSQMASYFDYWLTRHSGVGVQVIKRGT